jgi:hypothetical protein
LPVSAGSARRHSCTKQGKVEARFSRDAGGGDVFIEVLFQAVVTRNLMIMKTRIGNHTFRAYTGITAYLKNKGTLEAAQHIAKSSGSRFRLSPRSVPFPTPTRCADHGR